jgi:hypothetical protein
MRQLFLPDQSRNIDEEVGLELFESLSDMNWGLLFSPNWSLSIG